MTLISYKIIAAFIIFLTSIGTVIYPLRTAKKKSLPHHAESFELGEALASGIFLGAAFFHMLPNAIHAFQSIYGNEIYPFAELICVSGFLLLLLLERLSISRALFKPEYTIPYILALILIIHALTEGTALGIGSTFTEALMIFIAIIAHKGSASFALCVTLMRYNLSLNRILVIILFFSTMTPLGIIIGALVTLLTHSKAGQLTEAVFNAFAAGTFLYISTLHHIQFHHRIEEAQGMKEFGCLTLGLITMALIAVWA